MKINLGYLGRAAWALVLIAFTCVVGCSSSPTSSSPKAYDIGSLSTIDTVVGTGTEAVNGRTVTVHYTGWLYEPSAAANKGTKFDSSVDRGQPYSFILGVGQVIQGWDQGVRGMKVGGKRTLLIPSSLGYGTRGSGNSIPPGAALVFDVELLGVN